LNVEVKKYYSLIWCCH